MFSIFWIPHLIPSGVKTVLGLQVLLGEGCPSHQMMTEELLDGADLASTSRMLGDQAVLKEPIGKQSPIMPHRNIRL